MHRESFVALACLLASGAFAADVAPASGALPPSPSFAGVHVSVFGDIGKARWKYRRDYKLAPNAAGPSIGAGVGYDHQTSAGVVIGLLADVEVGRVRKKYVWENTPYTNFYSRITQEADLRAFGAVRGRVGYVLGGWLMPYATAGLALAENRETRELFSKYTGYQPSENRQFHRQSATMVGWAAGGGVEAMISPSVSVKADYLYADLGERIYRKVNTADARMKFSTLRFGLSYRFGVDSPAQDSGAEAAPPPAAAPFSGLHIGVFGSLPRTHWAYHASDDAAQDGAKSGRAFGLSAGYDHQTVAGLVAGIVGDIERGPAKRRTAKEWDSFVGEYGSYRRNTWTSGMTAFATARARLGYTIGGWVTPYATGGLAIGQNALRTDTFYRYNYGFSSGVYAVSHRQSATLVGWSVGGGVEALVTASVSAKIEFLHADFGAHRYRKTYGVGARVKHDTLRAGLNYRF